MAAAYSALPTSPDSDPQPGQDPTRFPPALSPPSRTSSLPTHWDHAPSEPKRARLNRVVVVAAAGLVLLAVLGARSGGVGADGGAARDALAKALGAEAGAAMAPGPAGLQLGTTGKLESEPVRPAAHIAANCTATAAATASPRRLNVNPTPKPPPPCSSPDERYLAYEPHSGFHNQRVSLVNALALAKLLNRTLLLPPARVGLATSWKPELHSKILPFEEDCKARAAGGFELAPHCNAGAWSYVSWGWIMADSFLAGHDVVDRWDDRQEWLELSRAEGGLGVAPEDTHVFDDTDRRSCQIYDSRDTEDHTKSGMGWAYRVDLPDLLAPPLADKKLLQFGSLFGTHRLDLALDASKEVYRDVQLSMIMDEDLLTEISDQIKARLGTYIGVHLRVTEGTFLDAAAEGLPVIFREVAQDLLGLPEDQVDRLLASSGVSSDAPRPDGRATLFVRGLEASDYGALRPRELVETNQIWWPVTASTRRPMSSNLSCRGTLHPADSPLAALNTPIFIATDARHPASLPLFAPFYNHLPCIFTLDDFAQPTELNEQQPVAGLVRMAHGERKSDFDGLPLAPYLFGFLDAMVSAKGDAFVGTTRSTFSEYAGKVLHGFYAGEWVRVAEADGEGGAGA